MNMVFEHGWMYMGIGSVFGMFFILSIQTYIYTNTVCRLIYLIIPKLGNSVDEISGTKTIGQFSRGINSKSLPF